MKATPSPIEADAADVAGEVREVTTVGWPSGYVYGATRYTDVILKESFSGRFADLVAALDQFHPTIGELRTGGGGRTVFVKRFDDSLAVMTLSESAQSCSVKLLTGDGCLL